MREIKFRAWDVEKQMMTGIEFAITSKGSWLTKDYLTQDEHWIREKTSRLIPMQYTGLHDKNGKEIYEGDILKWVDNSNYPSGNRQIVEFADFRIYPLVGAPASDCWKVIGNIYENSNLLKN